jgi:thiol-disulfide isomerase/thioredoxin
VVATVVAVAVVSGLGDGGGTASPPGTVTVEGTARTTLLEAGLPVPHFSAPSLDGGRFDWNTYLGGPVVLTVWAPWCPHCQAELPVLTQVASEFPGVHLVSVVSAIGDRPGPSPRGFMTDHGLSFPTAVDDRAKTLLTALGIDAFPSTYFVGADGTVMGAVQGETPPAVLRAAFRQLMMGRAA